jgi:transcriptional antiterminator Rof (Rho-off)
MEEYVTVPVWAERMSRQQLVTRKKNEDLPLDSEDEVILLRLRKKQQELTTPKQQTISQMKRQTKRSKWLLHMKSG